MLIEPPVLEHPTCLFKHLFPKKIFMWKDNIYMVMVCAANTNPKSAFSLTTANVVQFDPHIEVYPLPNAKLICGTVRVEDFNAD